MKFENNWVGYLERGYYQIKQSILNRVRIKVPEITDFSETNIFVIIISIFAGLVEQINYYIDQLARESFITTARRYSSVVKLSRLIDYRLRAANPASTDLTVKLLDSEEDEFHLSPGQSETIPQGTLLLVNGLSFYTVEEHIIKYPYNKIQVPIIQFTPVEKTFILGAVTAGMTYNLGTDYVHNSISLVIDSEPWVEVESFGLSSDTDKHIIVNISLDGNAYYQFGDGINGALPNIGDSVVLSYRTTKGHSGNISAFTIDQIEDNWVSLDYADKLKLVNTRPATGGTFYEDIEDIRRNAPLSLRTLNRAVTRQDFIDIAKLHPGVHSANLQYDCTKYIFLYISPKGGGVASVALLNSVADFFEDKRMITTFLQVKSTGESLIRLSINITGRLRMKADMIKNEVRRALLNQYGTGKRNVGDDIRISDIYALVDNQPSVDFANITHLALTPYFFPINTDEPLNYNLILKGTKINRTFIIIYHTGTTFILRKKVGNSDFFESYLELNNEYENDFFKITIESGSYTVADRWEFTIYPTNQDIEINDFSIPSLLDEHLSLNVTETHL